MADIDNEVLGQLNAGLDETVNLMEWLAVDMQALSCTVFSDPAFGHFGRAVLERIPVLNSLGVTKRLTAIGAAIADTIPDQNDRILRLLEHHRSDIVRQWAAYSINAFPGMSLQERLESVKKFATDRNMSVRECAWMAFRPHLVAELDEGLRYLQSWVIDSNPNVRRFAIEVTRPRSVWGKHIPTLKHDPGRAVALLEPVKADKNPYVRTAVANWLNDASKTRPDWVLFICDAWSNSDDPATQWIIRRALRSQRALNNVPIQQ